MIDIELKVFVLARPELQFARRSSHLITFPFISWKQTDK